MLLRAFPNRYVFIIYFIVTVWICVIRKRTARVSGNGADRVVAGKKFVGTRETTSNCFKTTGNRHVFCGKHSVTLLIDSCKTILVFNVSSCHWYFCTSFSWYLSFPSRSYGFPTNLLKHFPPHTPLSYKDPLLEYKSQSVSKTRSFLDVESCQMARTTPPRFLLFLSYHSNKIFCANKTRANTLECCRRSNL